MRSFFLWKIQNGFWELKENLKQKHMKKKKIHDYALWFEIITSIFFLKISAIV